MALKKYSLGQLLQRNNECNENLEFGASDVRGVLNTKGISSTKVGVDGRDLSKFIVVRPGGFIFNHRVHDKLGLGYNTTDNSFIFTNDYVSFYVKPEVKGIILLPDYLYIWFLRPEFDRYMLYKTYGSATLFFNWENMCELEIELPETTIQQKYVDIYNAMVANQQSYECGLEDLKLACEGYIEDLRRRLPTQKIGRYITQKNVRNKENNNTFVVGLSTKKEFREAQSRVNREELGNYKIVEPDEFAFVPTTDTWKVLAFAQNKFGKAAVVSPIYEVFSVDKSAVVPEYLAIWFSRNEFDRYARYNSWGSARENFSFEDMENVQIPVPAIGIQKAIAEIYLAYTSRKKINEQLKTNIKEICPILIKGSLEEGKTHEH